MSITHTITTSFIRSGDTAITGTQSVTDSSEQNLDVSLTALESGHLAAVAFDKDNIKSFFALSDCDVDIRRDASDGAIVVALKADIPYVWTYDSGLASPFAAGDVTAFYLDNGEDAVASVQIRMLLDEA